MAFADLIRLADRAVQAHLQSVTVTYAPEFGDAVEVPGMFDESFMIDDSGFAGVTQIVPAVLIRLEDLPTDPTDDNPTLTINGVRYCVRERPKDGIGGSIRLLLSRDTP